MGSKRDSLDKGGTSLKVAYVFPGQGSQKVGMGSDLYHSSHAARALFDDADEIYGSKLSSYCFYGPEASLKETLVAQPALFVSSVAGLAALKEAGAQAPHAVAGHSVGEYAALVAAGAMSFETGLHLVTRRAQEMQRAASTHPGTMSAVIGLDAEVVTDVCKEAQSITGEVIQVANYNSPAQMVISGTRNGMDEAVRLAKERGARKIIPLAVSGAFHSKLMSGAAEAMSVLLTSTKFEDPSIPIVANTTGEFETRAGEVQINLASQIESAVQWIKTILCLESDGVTHYVEIGGGSVLGGLIKRIAADPIVVTVEGMAGVRSWSEVNLI